MIRVICTVAVGLPDHTWSEAIVDMEVESLGDDGIYDFCNSQSPHILRQKYEQENIAVIFMTMIHHELV